MARCVTAAAQRGPPLAPGEEAGARRTEPGGRGRLQKAAWIAALPAGRALRPPPGDSAPGLPVPALVSGSFPQNHRNKSWQQSTETSYRSGVRRERPRCWGRRHSGPFPGPSVSSPPSRRAPLPPHSAPLGSGWEPGPTTLDPGGPFDPRGPFRPGIVGGCSREAQALAGTSQGAVSQLNHRGSFPANKSPAHGGESLPLPVFETSLANSVRSQTWPARQICNLLLHSSRLCIFRFHPFLRYDSSLSIFTIILIGQRKSLSRHKKKQALLQSGRVTSVT